ncbi:hypothetical protein DICVIV_01456 [Dictyocaulus viviparus]|uniref:Uncharacterized protein n=1 Tax=Dictyocaulus viviparus TaxID=29172 RepID=A0A0D8Y8Q4_DICVI|nr:hypothetical protein DICVIV_01456 [Dictyocaulus viviparus]
MKSHISELRSNFRSSLKTSQHLPNDFVITKTNTSATLLPYSYVPTCTNRRSPFRVHSFWYDFLPCFFPGQLTFLTIWTVQCDNYSCLILCNV